MHNICIHSTAFQLCMKEKKKEEGRRKKEDEQNRNF